MKKHSLTLTQYIDGKADHGNGQEHEIYLKKPIQVKVLNKIQ